MNKGLRIFYYVFISVFISSLIGLIILWENYEYEPGFEAKQGQFLYLLPWIILCSFNFLLGLLLLLASVMKSTVLRRVIILISIIPLNVIVIYLSVRDIYRIGYELGYIGLITTSVIFMVAMSLSVRKLGLWNKNEIY